MGALFGGSFHAFQVTATTTPAQTLAPSTLLQPRASSGVIVKSVTGTIYIGGDNTVSATTGFPLEEGATVSLPIDDPSKVWVATATGTETVAVIYG